MDNTAMKFINKKRGIAPFFISQMNNPFPNDLGYMYRS